jgi:hypothetical protein
LDVVEIKKVVDVYHKRLESKQESELPESARDAFTTFEKFVFCRLIALSLPLIKYRSLADVLDTLDTCKMTSTRKRDRIFRFLKRGALERAVQKCGADVRRSLETFKVRALTSSCHQT